jgi:hypothetical protein
VVVLRVFQRLLALTLNVYGMLKREVLQVFQPLVLPWITSLELHVVY